MSKTLIKIGALSVDASDYETPTERTFRNAWTLGERPEDGVISIDMEAAKEVWREKIRMAREPELVKLDAEFMKAMEIPESMLDENSESVREKRLSEIVTAKQALRDAPADLLINEATTPEELKLVQPAGLHIE